MQHGDHDSSQYPGTGTTPVHSPLPKEENLTLLRQKALFIQKSDLQDLSEIGEGACMHTCTCMHMHCVTYDHSTCTRRKLYYTLLHVRCTLCDFDKRNVRGSYYVMLGIADMCML